jgi:hypothetical protein
LIGQPEAGSRAATAARPAFVGCMRGLGGTPALEVAGRQARVPRDPREHPRSNLFVVVEAEHVVRPAGTSQRLVGAGLTFELPANPQ